MSRARHIVGCAPYMCAHGSDEDNTTAVSMEELERWLRARRGEAQRAYGLSKRWVDAIAIAPVALVFAYSALLAIPATRGFALSLRGENHPIELATFAFLLWGGLHGAALTRQVRQRGEGRLVVGFYAVFSLGLLFTAFEEVGWGQFFLGFETPAAWRSISGSGELTIHNLRGLHGHTEFLRVAFGLGGLAGVWAATRPAFRRIGAPFILLPWFLIIAGHALVDLSIDYVTIQRHFDYLIARLAEFVEMMIGMAGLLFVWLNGRGLARTWSARPRVAPPPERETVGV